MLEDIYELLLSRHLEPRWVKGELYVDVHGRTFALADYSGGLAVLRRSTARPSDKVFAEVCEGPDDALAALGLRSAPT